MLYMAFSLAFTAGGIIMLYLLWDAKPMEGQTLNAVVFNTIFANMGLHGSSHWLALTATLAFEAGLLLGGGQYRLPGRAFCAGEHGVGFLGAA